MQSLGNYRDLFNTTTYTGDIEADSLTINSDLDMKNYSIVNVNLLNGISPSQITTNQSDISDIKTSYLPLSGGVMTGSLDMATNNINNLTLLNGISPSQITTNQTDISDIKTNYIKRDGSVSMTGKLNMGFQKIENIGYPSQNMDGASKLYVDTEITQINTIWDDLNMTNHKITNLLDPTSAQDGATKNYVDTHASGNYLPLSGGVMAGDITMGTNLIFFDTLQNNYIGQTIGGIKLVSNGSIQLDGPLDMAQIGTNAIINVSDPQNAQDAATKNYTDTYVTGQLSTKQDLLTNGVDNLTSGEVDQLANIGGRIITPNQWHIISTMDQFLGTSDTHVCSKLITNAGTNSFPSHTFVTDQSSGLYQDAVNRVQITSAGNEAFRCELGLNTSYNDLNLDFNNLDYFNHAYGSSATVTNPTYSFTGDTDTGLYRVAENQLGISTGGVLRAQFTPVGNFCYRNLAMANNSIVEVNTIQAGMGNVGLPTYTFTNDTDTGVYSPSGDQVAVSCGNSQSFLFDGTTNVSQKNLTVNGYLTLNGFVYNTTPFTYYSYGAYGGIAAGGYFSMVTPHRVQALEFDATSDRRMKEDIIDVDDDIVDRFMQIKAKKYRWKMRHADDTQYNYGFIAQDMLEKRLNEFVHINNSEECKMTQTETIDSETGVLNPAKKCYNLNYMGLIPLLQQALKGALERIEKLTSRIETLETKITTI